MHRVRRNQCASYACVRGLVHMFIFCRRHISPLLHPFYFFVVELISCFGRCAVQVLRVVANTRALLCPESGRHPHSLADVRSGGRVEGKWSIMGWRVTSQSWVRRPIGTDSKATSSARLNRSVGAGNRCRCNSECGGALQNRGSPTPMQRACCGAELFFFFFSFF